MKKTNLMHPMNGLFGLLLLAFMFPSLTLNAQSGKKKKLRVNGMPIEHRERDLNKSLPNCDDSDFRTIDGTCNNQSSPDRREWGATDIQLRREVTSDYGDPDNWNDMAGQDRPSPRAISNACAAQPADGESDAGLSSFVFTWGQFLDHDIDLTPEGEIEYEPISMPVDEPLFTSDIPFFRSEIHNGTGVDNPRQQTNLITSWIDASNVYGSDEDRAIWLRTFEDGKLKTSAGDLLPFNTINGEYDSPIDPSAPSMAGENGTNKLFVAGDVRANEQVGLTSMHTLFVREHNRICDQLKQQGMNDDEEMYQIARKWVGAYMQVITYEEFLPALGVRPQKYNGYRKNVQPDISNVFATAAYRLGHTMVTEELLLRDDDCDEVGDGSLSLIEAFFSVDPIREYNIAPFLKGLAVQKQMEIDNYIVDELRNFLFATPGSPVVFGLDLASLNIQRGRDHGLPSYNAVRQAFGIPLAQSFSEINPYPIVYQALAEVYDDVNDVDAWVGMLAENHLPGKSVGRTLDRILSDQFERLRDGDYFYYENDDWFNKKDRDRIEDTRLSDIIERNTDLNRLQKNVFIAESCRDNDGPGGGHGGGRHHGHHGSNDRSSDLSDGGRLLDFSTLDSGLAVFPNPTNGDLRITLNTADATAASILVLDANGRTVMQSRITGFSGSFQEQMDLNHLTSGFYIVRVITETESFARRVVVE